MSEGDTDTLTAAPPAEQSTYSKSGVPLWSALLPLAVALLLLVWAAQRPDGRVHVWVLDVGQGDSIVLETPAGHVAVIDGGPDITSALAGVGRRIPFWKRDIDLVVVTHPHQDHMMALPELLRHYRVGHVVQTRFTSNTGVQAEWLHRIEQEHVPVHYAVRGETIAFEGEPDFRMEVLSPTSPDASREQAGGDINNTSIVLRIEYKDASMLLEGDAQAEAESSMVESMGAGLASQVLKVAHHGSDTSSTPAFLAAVRPAAAIISAGAGNKFGHPAQSTLESLQWVGAKVFRTDRNGAVEVITDGGKVWVRGEK